MSELSVGQLKGLTVNNNTITVPSGHKLYAPGHIVQAQQFIDRGQSSAGKTTRVTSTTTTFTNLMTRSIVTQLSNSAILVLASASSYAPSAAARAKARLTRNGTEINADHYAFYHDVATFALHTFNMVDYPGVAAGTTLTYNYDVALFQGSNTVQFAYGDAAGGPNTSIVLLEIAQ